MLEMKYLCNPSTGEVFTLPRPTPSQVYYASDYLALGCDPSSGQYKVIHFFYREQTNYEPACEVFTLGTDRWRSVGSPPFALSGIAPQVEWAIHWKAEFDMVVPDDEAMVSFDLQREEFHLFPPPPCCLLPRRHSLSFLLKNFGGVLCLVDFGDFEEMQMDIWLMKDYDSRLWVKQYSIDVTPVLIDWRDGVIPIAPLSDGRILMSLPKEKLLYYDPLSKTFDDCELIVDQMFQSDVYVESFLSLGSR